ncbi:hypothetical protein GCM10007852_23320 [Agaribacter marinus]|uniref:Uncharacterized protein n=2 Tax=Agaribacter marinus TaxID=1431249 RepID=A0AA37SZU2_9ALTE|nr:hypothetical protein GCM10007852_23320 [Agaribacter marinus]
MLLTLFGSAFPVLKSFISINTFILGALGVMLCIMALITSSHEPWLPYVLMLSVTLLIAGWFLVRFSHKTKQAH